MTDVVKEIEITAALSADYQDAFRAASSIASSSAKELSALTKQETQLQQLLTISANAQKAAAEGNSKEADKLSSQYDSLAVKLGLVDKSAEAVAAELSKVGQKKKEVTELNAAAKKSAAFGKLAKDIQAYTKAAQKTKDPAIIRHLDQMKKKFREMGGAIPSERKLGVFARMRASLAELPGPIGKVASGFGSINKAALVVGGFAAVGTAAVALTKKMWDLGVSTMQAGDQIAKTSKQLGIDAESYQEFAWAVGLGGASEEDLASGLKTLNKQMEAAASGNSRAKKAFEELGISMDDVKSMNTEEMFVRISDALAQVDDVSKKTKTTMELFGGSGNKLAEAIKGGSSELEKMRKEAREAGYVLSNDDLKKAEEAADNYARAQMQLKGALNAVGVEVMPTVNETLVDLVQLIRENKDDIKDFAKLLGGGFKVAMRLVRDEMRYLLALFEIIKGSVEFWQVELPVIGDTIAGAFTAASDAVVGAFNSAYDTVSGVIGAIRDTVTETFDSLYGLITGIPDKVSDGLNAAKEFISSWFSELASSASSWVTGLMDEIASFIMEKVNWLSDSLRSIPILGQLLEDEPSLAAGSGGVTIQVQNSIDARGAAPGAGAEISRAVSSSTGQTGASIAAALGSYNDLSYAR